MAAFSQKSGSSVSQKEIKELQEQLSDLMVEKFAVLLFEKPYLEAEYQKALGQKLYKLFKKKIDCLKLTKEIDLLRAYYTKDEIKNALDSEFETWDERGKELLESYDQACEYLDEHAQVESHPKFIARLKEIVKKTHPFLNENIDPEISKQWKLFENASKSGQIQKASELLSNLENYANRIKNEHQKTSKKEFYSFLSEHFEDMKTQIRLIHSKFPFNLKNSLQSDAWLKERNEAIDEEESEVSCQYEVLKKKIEELKKLRSLD